MAVAHMGETQVKGIKASASVEICITGAARQVRSEERFSAGVGVVRSRGLNDSMVTTPRYDNNLGAAFMYDQQCKMWEEEAKEKKNILLHFM